MFLKGFLRLICEYKSYQIALASLLKQHYYHLQTF